MTRATSKTVSRVPVPPGLKTSTVLFPRRLKCLACGRKLGADRAPVLLGVYCSARCASMPEPAKDPEQAPRSCRRQNAGAWVFKNRYRCASEVPPRQLDDSSMELYWCTDSCGHLHAGRSLVAPDKAATRVLRNRKQVADLLVTARGRATVKQVADATGVRQVRIREWEDPGFDTPSFSALLALLPAYRIQLAAVF